jgi:hypothetical protein
MTDDEIRAAIVWTIDDDVSSPGYSYSSMEEACADCGTTPIYSFVSPIRGTRYMCGNYVEYVATLNFDPVERDHIGCAPEPIDPACCVIRNTYIVQGQDGFAQVYNTDSFDQCRIIPITAPTVEFTPQSCDGWDCSGNCDGQHDGLYATSNISCVDCLGKLDSECEDIGLDTCAETGSTWCYQADENEWYCGKCCQVPINACVNYWLADGYSGDWQLYGLAPISTICLTSAELADMLADPGFYGYPNVWTYDPNEPCWQYQWTYVTSTYCREEQGCIAPTPALPPPPPPDCYPNDD